MDKIKHNFKKKFGQNFLKNEQCINEIINVSGISTSCNSLTIEVGPGAGALTDKLSMVSNNVLAYEVDFDLKERLDTKFLNSNVKILYKDFLTSNISDDILQYNYDNLFFVSNVPYYITTPILMKLIKSNLNFQNIVMMVQKEVADRFSSSVGNKNYGSITVFLNYYFDIKKEIYVSRENFYPVPNVDSEVISLKPKTKKLDLIDFHFFEQLVKDSFQFKRKNLRNNLKKYDLTIIENILKKYNLSLSSRAENVSVDIFIEIANSLC